ncbi:unnamed protein product [Ranitomeya imitator]|uniref:Insertion element IS150 protein InsJ-like helix-turn-helix domain-containing protein n=1 Tax=Ranitomeya imitator TaxID=111125 RepID=A0ABN9L5P8_9NEOB|nr:unnamed protein product [Ranitomeya imitator]
MTKILLDLRSWGEACDDTVPDGDIGHSHYLTPQECWQSIIITRPSVSVIILYPECQCHYPVPRVSVSLSCTPSVSVIILYPQCQCHYPVPPVSVSLSCTPSVSVIILYPQCQCHYPVPPVSVSLSCTPSVSVNILYPPTSLSCTPSVSVIILYPQCQCHYPVPPVSVSLSCTPSVIILYPECQRHYPVPPVMRRTLQPTQVAQVVQLIQDGTSMRAVARRFAVSVSVVSRGWRRYQEKGQYIRKRGGGHRRATT